MAFPTKAELNGRALYVVLSTGPATDTDYTHYVGTDKAQAESVARHFQGVVVEGVIAYDGREAGEE